MRVEVTSPDGCVEREIVGSVAIGRQPGRGGIVIGKGDSSISRIAVRLTVNGKETFVENLSTYAKLEIHSNAPVRSLLPRESLRLAHDTLVVVPGNRFPFRIEIADVRPAPRPRRAALGVTRRSVGRRRRRGDEHRQLALVALCLPRFDPRHFPGRLLTAPQIVEQLQLVGQTVTAKAVNNKLLRLRQQLCDDHGVFLGNREELAAFAIEHDMVTMNDVEDLQARQQRRQRRILRAQAR